MPDKIGHTFRDRIVGSEAYHDESPGPDPNLMRVLLTSGIALRPNTIVANQIGGNSNAKSCIGFDRGRCFMDHRAGSGKG